jgi:hypothetical protein
MRCAYVGAQSAATALLFSYVSLYNNDPQGRVFAIHDIGNGITPAGISQLSIDKGQIGANTVTPSPVMSNQPVPPGLLTTGAVTAGTVRLQNGIVAGQAQWTHDFPFIVLTQGYRITAWGNAVNTAFVCGFWYQVLGMDELMGLEAAPALVIPKVLKLTVETE